MRWPAYEMLEMLEYRKKYNLIEYIYFFNSLRISRISYACQRISASRAKHFTHFMGVLFTLQSLTISAARPDAAIQNRTARDPSTTAGRAASRGESKGWWAQAVGPRGRVCALACVSPQSLS